MASPSSEPAPASIGFVPADEAEKPLVVVAVGTDHHPFARLVDWMDGWAGAHPDVDVLIQRGTAAETVNATSRALVPHRELCQLFGRATAVVAHGGPATIMDVRSSGLVPLVVPRDPDRGEHVDDHQQRFARHLARVSMAKIVAEIDELDALLGPALTDPDTYRIDTVDGAAPGVLAFGRIVDDLLGCYTPIVPAQPPEGR
ncbi:MAG: glycosyltransferase [Actinomycetota bacterium]